MFVCVPVYIVVNLAFKSVQFVIHIYFTFAPYSFPTLNDRAKKLLNFVELVELELIVIRC